MIKWLVAGVVTVALLLGVLWILVLDEMFDNNENDEAYIEAVHKIVPLSKNGSDQSIIDTGKGLCESLDIVGPSITRDELMAVGWGFVEGADGWVTMGQVGAMMGNAVTYYCPEYVDDVQRIVAAEALQ